MRKTHMVVRKTWERTYRSKTNAWLVVIDPPKGQRMTFVEDRSRSLDDVCKQLQISNAKAGREFSYKIAKDRSNFTLRYPNIKRKVKGYIRYSVPPNTGEKR